MEKIADLRPQFSFEVNTEDESGGFALSPAIGGMKVPVCFRGFFTPMNGELLYNALSCLSGLYLEELMKKTHIDESNISNCLIFRRGRRARVYVNIPIVANLVSKKDVKKGALISREDIADVREVQFPGVEIESDCGVIFIFSFGWRRYLYFDLIPLLPPDQRATLIGDLPQTSIDKIVPKLYTYALFPELHESNGEHVSKAVKNGWFPFIRLLGKRYDAIIQAIENDFQIEQVERQIMDSFNDEFVYLMVDNWMNKEQFRDNADFFRTGAKHYLNGDYLSSISVLYPRIEGLMQYLFLGKDTRASQGKMVEKLEETARENNPNSILFYESEFKQYLKDFYFSNFDLQKGDFDLSRHTVAHGVAPAILFNRKNALLGLLILDQIYFYL